MKFTKMHGLGNDYVYVNGFTEKLGDVNATARAISDRHFGVGGDGMIVILPSEVADVRMRMFNLDGSEGVMCGNGIRCVAKYSYDHGLSKQNPLRVETGRGVLSIAMDVNADDKVERVTVDMDEPILDVDRIPVELPRPAPGNRILDFPLNKYIPLSAPAAWMEDCGLDTRMTCVSMGNPHVVIFCKRVDAVPLEMIGPFLERQTIFPKRINVHFAQVEDRGEITMRTWERGSGVTLACGTGACATLVAAVLTGRCDREAIVHLPGGDLTIAWDEKTNHVFMTGPATEVFSGEWMAEC